MCKAFLISHFDVCMGDGLKGLYLIYVVWGKWLWWGRRYKVHEICGENGVHKVCMQTESVQVSHVAMDLGEGTQHDFFISGLVGKKNLM